MFNVKCRRRDVDCFGSGEFGASREGRPHRGVDYAALPGSIILSPFDCTVNRIGYPYADKSRREYKLIELIIDAQTRCKIMYIDALVKPGDKIRTGDKLGIVQDLDKIYKGITPHFHLEIIVEGVHVDPEAWLKMR